MEGSRHDLSSCTPNRQPTSAIIRNVIYEIAWDAHFYIARISCSYIVLRFYENKQFIQNQAPVVNQTFWCTASQVCFIFYIVCIFYLYKVFRLTALSNTQISKTNSTLFYWSVVEYMLSYICNLILLSNIYIWIGKYKTVPFSTICIYLGALVLSIK